MEESGYWITRLLFQRGLAFTYLIAFAAVLWQFNALLGEKGLLPVPQFLQRVSFLNAPSLFHFLPARDSIFTLFAWAGILLSLLALLGISERFGTLVSMGVWAVLWVLYLSFVNVGQTFYGFGWESILLEAGFFAVFLGGANTQPSFLTIVLLRWLLFRVMFGAGLIKLRGDECWRKLTCLFYHYETQPMPNPFSWYFHWLPQSIHKFGVLFNHFAELVVPLAYFMPQPVSAIAGVITILFHGWLFVSGNFSWLGFLTIILAISTFSDAQLKLLFSLSPPLLQPISNFHWYAIASVTFLVIVLSYYPIRNMLSRYQVMNRSYNPFHLVSTYGAFGSITKPRYEVIIEGTDEKILTAHTKWREYEFMGKPGNVSKRPPQIAPYHLRLDWLMWFLPFQVALTREGVVVPYGYEPWFLRFVEKLLQGDKATLKLLKKNPFPEKPPSSIRALFYKYQFTTPQEKRATRTWWTRELIGTYLPPISVQNSP